MKVDEKACDIHDGRTFFSLLYISLFPMILHYESGFEKTHRTENQILTDLTPGV